ncbi:MAG: amino acid adenylation domain-containing protein, partial [Acidobacteria bacterium]|nr:amino acid adenylation domain-containing protein [Acidobacteriota bacterium]
MLGKDDIKDMYPLSPMQEGILFHYLVDKNSFPYFEQISYRVNGEINIKLFDEAFNRLIDRYDILRTIFFHEKVKRPLQVVLKKRKAAVYYEDISALTENETGDFLRNFKEKDKKKGFDLSKGLPIRINIIKIAQEQYEIIWCYHHIIMDGWCADILIKEMIYIYRQLTAGGKIELPTPVSYRQFIKWLEQQDKEKGLNYWKTYLEDYENPAGIPKIEPGEKEFHQEQLRLRIDKELTGKLTAVANESQVTVSTFFHTVWGILLQRYNDTGDVVFGSVVSGRSADIPGIENAIGLFINTVPVRIHCPQHEKFQQLLKGVQEELLASRAYEYLPLVEILSAARQKQDLINHIVVVENYAPIGEKNTDSQKENTIGFSITHSEIVEQTNYDLDVIVNPGQQLLIRLRYNSRVYENEMMQKLGVHLLQIIQQVAADPKIPLNEIEILSPPERKQLLYEFNDTAAGFPAEKMIHHFFQEQVEKIPDHIALVGAGGGEEEKRRREEEKNGGVETLRATSLQITYLKLNEQSNRLAGLLSEKGVGPDTIVAMLLERSLEIITCILAILKAGGAYMPIDPDYPRDRIDYMLKDSNSRILITDDEKKKTNNCQSSIVNSQLSTGESPGNFQHSAFSIQHSNFSNLAYIIYTSGSTGKPKGVLIHHRNVVRLMINDRTPFDFGNSDIWTLFHSYCFDFSVWEMYGALMFGGKLILLSAMMVRDPGLFIHVLIKEKVTVLNQTPSAFYNLIMTSEELGVKAGEFALKYVIFGGEALNPLKLKSWKQKFPSIQLINMFGITETTVHVTYKEIQLQDTYSTLSNIGVPIPTLTTYVMNKNMRLQPIGICGELCVGGEGVARGYLNRPELTAERFVENPYKTGERLYRSGDLGKLSPGKDLEYLGRIDQQVKVRGYRIEVGEIEKCLLAHSEIKDAVVLLKSDENNDRFLCAFLVGTPGLLTGGIAALKEFLAQSLPGYMIPAFFIQVDKIPLTPNGKVDKKSLAQYQISHLKSQAEPTEPTNETERKLVEIWKNILALDHIGIDDNFFNIGGDSIKAIRLISTANNTLNANLKVVDVFTGNTIREMAGLLTNKTVDHDDDDALRQAQKQIAELRDKVVNSGKLPGDIEGIYPMSDIEKGMIFHAYQNSEEAIYHDQFVYYQKYTLFQPEIFRQALAQMIEKHSALRVSYNVDDFGEFVHFIHKPFPPVYKHFEIRELDKEHQRRYIEKYMVDDRKDRWIIKSPPLCRMATFDLGGNNICAVWTFHHAILDGWSNASLMTELNNTYLELKVDKNYTPTRLRISYEAFILKEIAEKKKLSNMEFWKNELENYKRITFPGVGQNESAEFHNYHPPRNNILNEKLPAAVKYYNASLKNLSFAAYVYMLSMLTYENDVVVGLISNNRPEMEDGDKLIGCFLNTLPFRINIPDEISWAEYIHLVDEKLLNLKRYDKVTFFEIVKTIGERNHLENAIFDTVFNYIDFHIYRQASMEEGQKQKQTSNERNALIQGYERTNTLFDFNVAPVAQGINVSFRYSTLIISDELAGKLYGYFENILTQLVSSPQGLINRNEILSYEEKQKLLFDFNNTAAEYPKNKTINEIFEEQVSKTSDHIAVTGESVLFLRFLGPVSLSYRQLNEQSGRIAGLLIERGVLPDNIVAIMMERSIEMITGIFGILKSGGAYMPIDPTYPRERIDYMLKDSKAKLIINYEFLKDVPQATFLQHSAFITQHSNHLCYIIYTSGSTGKPKGVAIKHHSLVNRLNWMQKKYPLDQKDTILQKTTFTFDVSVWEIFWWAVVGAKVCLLIPGGEKDPETITLTVERNNVTTMHFVPSMLNVFLDYLKVSGNVKKLAVLKQVIASGEALSPGQVKIFNELVNKKNGTLLANLYGPTEATIDVSYFDCPDDGEKKIIPIGKPIDNICLYILNKHLHIQPIGIFGELYISGIGLASGYLNRPELTVERFKRIVIRHSSFGTRDKRIVNGHLSLVTGEFKRDDNSLNPLNLTNDQCPMTNDYFYSTGDLARRLHDGNIEFLGRIDHQVKIRGFRIELGEIENKLSSHPDISNSVVIVNEDENGNKNLCAYITAKREFMVSQLRDFLAGKLPDYMLPTYFVTLDKIPVTNNGKIDYHALPVPQKISIRDNVAYIEPQTIVEKKLVEVWEKVLGRTHIGMNENYFQAGGDSIKSIQIVSRLSSSGYKVEMKDLFKYPVLKDLVPHITKLKHFPDQSVIIGTIPLTPVQKMFFEQSYQSPHHFNQAVMFYSKNRLDKQILKDVFTKIQEHHDALRMTYQLNPQTGKILQTGHGTDYPVSLEEHDIIDIEQMQKEINRIQMSIDFEKGPLMKLGLFHLEDGDRLLIVIHHLVIDGISWRILFEDIETLFGYYKQGHQPELPPKTDSFKVWAEQLSTYADSHLFLKKKDYWRELEAEPISYIEKDFETGVDYIKDTRKESFTLDENETSLLLTKAGRAFKTEINDILLTALGMSIQKVFGKERMLIAFEGHGREDILPDMDISRTIGWFTTFYPVPLKIPYAHDPGRQIKEVKEALRKIPDKGIGYGILRYLTDEKNKKEIEFRLNPQISFNYLGQFDSDMKQLSSFNFAKEPAGNTQSLNNKRDYLFDITAMVANKRLAMQISFNKTHFKEETIFSWADNLKTELRHLIAYCCSKEKTGYTPSDFTYKGLSIESVDRLMVLYPNLEDLYTLTPMQEGMLFHALADEKSHSYFEQTSYRLQNELDIALVEKSLNALFKRHDILRTAFVYNDIERHIQVVLQDRTVDFYYEDISQMTEWEEKENYAREFKTKDKARSFDLSKDTLVRAAILKLGNREYQFTWSFHHILMDGWCVGILNSEFFEIYKSYLEKRPYRLPEVKPFRTYIQWLEKQDSEKSANYWKNYLDSFEEQTGIPNAKILLKEEHQYRNETVSINFDLKKTTGLNKIAVENQVTLNTVAQALWGILLGKYNGKEDVVFGVVVSGRPPGLEGVESMVGLFINTIPLRIQFAGNMKFYRLIQLLQEEALASERYHFHPLAEIQSETSLKQNLIDHIFVFENFPVSEQILGSGNSKEEKNNKLAFNVRNVDVFEQTNYDFNIILGGANRLSITFKYNGNVYDRGLVERIAQHYILAVDQVIENKELGIRDLTLLSGLEKKRVLYEFNDTEAVYPHDKTIHQLFAEQVSKTPDHIAVIGETVRSVRSVQLTYLQLNEQSDRVAGVLIDRGVQPDAIVGIMVERSIEMIIGILGILKSGGAYLPIDPGYPQERIDYMLKDSAASILLTNDEKKKDNCQCSIANNQLSMENKLAYVIYTSGTTGKPKGVLVEHRNVVNTVTWFIMEHKIGIHTRMLQISDYTFDASVNQIFGALLSGAGLFIIQEELRTDFARLRDYIIYHRINIINFVPSVLKELLCYVDKLKNLHTVLSGADKLEESTTPIYGI